MKRLLLVLLALTLLAGCANADNTPGSTPAIEATPISTPTPDALKDNTGGEGETATHDPVKATIEMADGGIIELELYPDIAPQSVYNFASLARQGFYDGLIFHRVISGFMVQGGDPDGTGSGGPGYGIKGEFASNGVENNLSHTRGVVSMARQGDPLRDSAGSQFFIVHADSTFLDGGYAAFGKVTSGIEVVDAIAAVQTRAERPVKDVVIKTITIDGPELPEPNKLK